jgi:hypothetical protein
MTKRSVTLRRRMNVPLSFPIDLCHQHLCRSHDDDGTAAYASIVGLPEQFMEGG